MLGEGRKRSEEIERMTVRRGRLCEQPASEDASRGASNGRSPVQSCWRQLVHYTVFLLHPKKILISELLSGREIDFELVNMYICTVKRRTTDAARRALQNTGSLRDSELFSAFVSCSQEKRLAESLSAFAYVLPPLNAPFENAKGSGTPDRGNYRPNRKTANANQTLECATTHRSGYHVNTRNAVTPLLHAAAEVTTGTDHEPWRRAVATRSFERNVPTLSSLVPFSALVPPLQRSASFKTGSSTGAAPPSQPPGRVPPPSPPPLCPPRRRRLAHGRGGTG